MANTPLAGSLAKASNWSDAFPTDIDGWDTYTPTWTQGGSTITKTSACAYFKTGRLVVARFNVSASSAGVANNAVQLTYPVAPAAAMVGMSMGTFWFNDSGTSFYNGTVYCASTSVMQFFNGGANVAFMGQTGGGFGVAIASGDGLTGVITYESAS